MDFFGIVLIGLGAWLVMSAYANRPPVKTITEIVAHPDKATEILAASAGTWTPSFNTAAFLAANNADGATLTKGAGINGGDGGTAVAFARAQIGKPYQWGGTGNPSYDCSGLVQAAWASAGKTISRTTYSQLVDARLQTVAKALQAGDLIYPNSGHVQMYTGEGTLVEAARPGTAIRELPYKASVTDVVRRVV